MTAKKRWTSSFKTESEELSENISWNSSSSEDGEDEFKHSKKLKPSFPEFERELKLTVINPIKINKKPLKKTEEKPVSVLSESLNISTFTSEENVIDFGKESPILEPRAKFSCSVSDSPIILQNYMVRETSPVITNREIIKKIRSKRREFIRRSTKIDGSSPDIFSSQCSKIIEETDSPDRTVIPTTNCSQDMGSIELVSSQDSSSLVIVDATTSDSSLARSDFSNQCYHQPSPRRKNCKKNGLLEQVQRSLNLQKSRLSLWHHDIFCKNLIPSELEHIKGKINCKWKDFGCTMLKCSKDVGDIAESEMFLVSLGCNPDHNLACNVGEIIRIFPPFKEQIVQFENKEVKLYHNITKILTDTSSGS